jgi:hypothetical protein
VGASRGGEAGIRRRRRRRSVGGTEGGELRQGVGGRYHSAVGEQVERITLTKQPEPGLRFLLCGIGGGDGKEAFAANSGYADTTKATIPTHSDTETT